MHYEEGVYFIWVNIQLAVLCNGSWFGVMEL